MSLGHQSQTLTIPWSWTLGNHWRNVITSTSGRDGIFAKSSRRDTSRQSVQLWNW